MTQPNQLIELPQPSVFVRGQRPAFRRMIPANAMHLARFLLGGPERIVMIRYEEYALQLRGRAGGGEVLIFTPDERQDGRVLLQSVLRTDWDVLSWLWDRPGQLIETTWADEHFYHLLSPEANDTFRWRQWGTQSACDVVLSRAESEHIISEIRRLPGRDDLTREDENGNIQQAKVRKPKRWELPGGCIACEATPGETHEQSCYLAEEGDEAAESLWTLQADGRRMGPYHHDLLPFDYVANHLQYDMLLISPGDMFVTHYYPNMPGLTGNGRSSEPLRFSNATIMLGMFRDCILHNQVRIEANIVRDLIAQHNAVEGTSGATMMTNEWSEQLDVAWNAQGVALRQHVPAREESGSMVVPWDVWRRCVEAADEFLAWKGREY